MFATLILAAVAGGVVAAPPLPLPDAASPVATVRAAGVQIYRCTAGPQGALAWVLERPLATLYRDDGTIFGMHGAGPSYVASDGSAIVVDAANPIERVAQPTAVPWLAIRVTYHYGTGVLTDVRYVERFDTTGGLAPSASECTTDLVGSKQAREYTGRYEFFR